MISVQGTGEDDFSLGYGCLIVMRKGYCHGVKDNQKVDGMVVLKLFWRR